MRVLVCGGRDYNDRITFDAMMDASGATVVINGGASGADFLASQWAWSRGVPCVVFGAEWEKFGKFAGPIRNQRMLDEGKPDKVLAFPGGRGTQDMVRRAIAAGLPVSGPPAPKEDR